MSRLTLACLFALTARFCAGQEFKPGYVRIKGGQDRMGLIGTLISGKPESIQYKENETADLVLYKASDVEGYGLTNGIYFNSFLNPDGNPNNWTFVELLVQGGEMTLIRRNNMYFVLPRGSKEFTHLDNRYRKLLTDLMKNCPWVASRSPKVRLSRAALAEHVKAYNECVAIKNPNLDGMQRNVSVGLVGGYDNSTVSFSDPDQVLTRFLTGKPLYDKSFVQAGIDLTLKSYRVSNYIGVFMSALYNSNHYQTVSQTRFGNSSQVDEYSIHYTQLKFPLGIELSPPSRKRILAHGRAGIIVPMTLNVTATHPYSEITTGSGVFYEEPANVTEFKNKIMFTTALGLDFKVARQSKVRLQLGWSMGGASAVAKREGSVDNSVTGKMTSWSLMTGFIF